MAPAGGTTTTATANNAPIRNSCVYLRRCFNKRKNGMRETLRILLRKKKKGKKGWLRRIESPNTTAKHLTAAEKKKAMDLLFLMKYDFRAVPAIAFAWGVSKNTIRNIENKWNENPDAELERRERWDKGKTIFNSEDMRKRMFTAKAVYAKEFRSRHPGQKISAEQLNKLWTNEDPSVKEHCESVAKEWLNGVDLFSELARALQVSKGSASWKGLATLISGNNKPQIVSGETIRKMVMSLPDSTYKAPKMKPVLTRGDIVQRKQWAEEFLLFVQSSMIFATKKQILHVHMDEKWFYLYVARQNNKFVPFLGIDPVVAECVRSSSKSNIEKTMGIVSTGFAPIDNDMTKGGASVLVNCVRVGKLRVAERDAFKRVYRSDGSCHYPKIRENQLRVKGQEYFHDCEITGSDPGTNDNPKFDLVSFFRHVELPKLDQLCAEYHRNNPAKEMVVRYQMKGAGPHRDDVFNEYMEDEFNNRRWIWTFQPPNSPITNINDECLLPVLSKRISQHQEGTRSGNRMMSGDELWSLVENCYEEISQKVLSHGFGRHVQIACAILECNGGDEFAVGSSSHCNTRKCCVPFYGEYPDDQKSTALSGKALGVEIVTLYGDDDDDDAAAAAAADENHDNENRNQLNYKQPDFVGTNVRDIFDRMSATALQILFDGIPMTHPWFEHVSNAYTVATVVDDDLLDEDQL